MWTLLREPNKAYKEGWNCHQIGRNIEEDELEWWKENTYIQWKSRWIKTCYNCAKNVHNLSKSKCVHPVDCINCLMNSNKTLNYSKHRAAKSSDYQ